MKSILALAATVLMASTAPAAVTTYTSQATFAAALGTSVTVDFSDATLVPGLSYSSSAGNIGGGLFNDRVFRGGATTTFSFAGGTYGAGAFFDETPGGFGQGLHFTLNLTGGGTVGVGQIDGYTGGFFGFISTNKFDSVLLDAGVSSAVAETYNLDNLQIGAVPEPASWALMIGGFAMTGFAMRRRVAVAA